MNYCNESGARNAFEATHPGNHYLADAMTMKKMLKTFLLRNRTIVFVVISLFKYTFKVLFFVFPDLCYVMML